MTKKIIHMPKVVPARTDPFGRRRSKKAIGARGDGLSLSASGQALRQPETLAQLEARRKLAAHLSELRVACLAIIASAHARDLMRRDRRHAFSHARMIAVYAAHVASSISMKDLAAATGRHHTTISGMIRLVEDRRDDAAFDELVGAVELAAIAILGQVEAGAFQEGRVHG